MEEKQAKLTELEKYLSYTTEMFLPTLDEMGRSTEHMVQLSSAYKQVVHSMTGDKYAIKERLATGLCIGIIFPKGRRYRASQ